MSAVSLTKGAGPGRQLGAFVASDGRRFRVARVGERVMVSYEQQPSGRTGMALELTLDEGDVADSRWYSTWVGASADDHAAVLGPTMELLAEHLEVTWKAEVATKTLRLHQHSEQEAFDGASTDE